MPDETDWLPLIEQLDGAPYRAGITQPGQATHRITFDTGLDDSEIETVETVFGFRFPPDLRGLLQTALPHGPKFPDWRNGSKDSLAEWLDMPSKGVLFDIEHNDFWLEEWGPRPASTNEALAFASKLIAAAPRLIPLFSHRMLPAEPSCAGNPVFSVHQTDIIYYGADLAGYFRNEFDLPGSEPQAAKHRPIRFWDVSRFQDARWKRGAVAYPQDTD